MPLLKDFVQGTEKWLQYRKGHIMATDCGVIMNMNKWTTPTELWEEKLGFRDPKPMNEAMKRGQDLEKEALLLACDVIDIKFYPCVYQSDKYDWMGASLDGFSNCGKYVLEIKCPKESIHDEHTEGVIAEYYMSQIQHQLFVTGAEIAYFFSYRPESENKYAIQEIRLDREFIERMVEKELEFWRCMCTMSPPPDTWKLKASKNIM